MRRTTDMTEVLYHATWPTRRKDIVTGGLRPGTYFANTPGYAAAFLAMRGGEFVGLMEIDTPDGPAQVPNVVIHDHVEVFAVHVDALDPDLLHESNDHAADFYPDDLRCWTYDGDVSPHALLNVRVDISGVAA